MSERDWGSLLDGLGIAVDPRQGSQRTALAGLLATAEANPDVAGVYLYGSLARGGGDGHSDIDLTLEAAPGKFAGLWSARRELAAGAGEPILELEHQWGPTTEEACYACMMRGGMYIDLVIRRAGSPPKPGEVALMPKAEDDTVGVLVADEPPAVAPHPMDDTFALFWMGSLLCAKYIARGDMWGALDFVESRRRLFLRAWWLVRDAALAEELPARATVDLPVPVRQRLAEAVPQLDRKQLASALWAVTALMQDIGPELAAGSGREYPARGAAAVLETMRSLFAPLGLPDAPAGAAEPVAVDSTAPVSLRAVGQDNVRAVVRLEVSPDQRHVVAPNAVSLAQALVTPDNAWYRAIYAADIPVGFVMLYQDHAKGEYFLWRLMIGARYQHLGFGRRAVELLIEHVRSQPNAEQLGVSYHKEPGGPEGFYRKLGFVETGEVDEGEHIAVLKLS